MVSGPQQQFRHAGSGRGFGWRSPTRNRHWAGSKGKYDLVDDVLEELGADFFLRGIAIRPGKPLVFGRARGKFFFGLPGNPVSSFVTCNLFARPAISVLAGSTFERPLFLRARLVKPVQ